MHSIRATNLLFNYNIIMLLDYASRSPPCIYSYMCMLPDLILCYTDKLELYIFYMYNLYFININVVSWIFFPYRIIYYFKGLHKGVFLFVLA